MYAQCSMASKCKTYSNIDREEKETFCKCLDISSNRSIFNTHIHTIFDVKVDRKKGMNANNLTISLFITVCREHDQYVYSKREEKRRERRETQLGILRFNKIEHCRLIYFLYCCTTPTVYAHTLPLPMPLPPTILVNQIKCHHCCHRCRSRERKTYF